MQESAIHPNKTGVIIIIYPGYNGDLNGYNGKYQKIAEMLDQKGIGAVVRTSNRPIEANYYGESVRGELEETIAYALENSDEICGSRSPQLYLMGVSAGAGAIAAVAHQYPQVKRILLVAPASDAGRWNIEEGIKHYEGELYITVGEHDGVVGASFPRGISKQARRASVTRLVIVPNCDHQFRGKRNGMILSKAPLWAFAGDETYPDPEGGMVLYE